MLDRSASMRAHDVAPSRFSRATEEIRTFLKNKPENIDRVGLVGFAEQLADPVVPDARPRHRRVLPGLDRAAIRRPSSGTNIGAALKNALEVARKDDRKTRKIFVLLSDGEDYGGELNRQLAVYRQEGHHINSIGIGSDEEVPVPEMQPDGTRDAAPRRGRPHRPHPLRGVDAARARDQHRRALPAVADRRRPRPRRCTKSSRASASWSAGARRPNIATCIRRRWRWPRRRSRPSGSSYDRTQEQRTLNAQAAGEIITGLEHEIGKVIVGQHTLIRRMLTALFAAIPFAVSKGRARSGCGHLLLEGVPGVAKTLTATTLAQAISAKFQRVQLTPDLLPADILGTRIYDAKTATFRIEQGPVFTNILLADEINRATPKTQSALLEAMQERQVTLADTTFPLDDPFWVLATQNPVEQEGVYTLPEAQLDRFSMMLRVGYPSAGRGSRDAAGADEPDDDRAARLAVGRHACCASSSTRRSTSTPRSSSTSSGSAARRAIRAASAAPICARCCSSASRRAPTSTCWR